MCIARRPLILDLDFTLLHLECRPEAIEVPGRTRSAWIAPQTVDALLALQNDFDIVLATARSWDGTRWVCDGLAAYGVKIFALVLEDGARLGRAGQLQPLDAELEIKLLRVYIEAQKTVAWPAFAWQNDFKSCLVARCENAENAAQLQQIFVENLEKFAASTRIFRDGRKIYLLSRRADKWSALQQLLGERAALSAGVGDGANDLCWLAEIALPCTLAGAAPSVTALVRERKGYLSPHGGHDGIEDVLWYLGQVERNSILQDR